MEKTIVTYNHDHVNDTRLEYWKDADGQHIELSFTSEDPDCGTETLYYNDSGNSGLPEMARELLEEVSDYLDRTENGLRRSLGDPVYDDYTNSSLYAFEALLNKIVRK